MNGGQALFVQGLDNLCGDAGNQGVGRNNGALGNNSTGSYNGALANNGAVQNSGMHADQAVVLNSAGMEQSAVTYGYIIAHDAGIIVSNVQYAVVLNITLTANLDAVYVATNGNAGPYAGIFFDFYLADEGCSIKSICFFVNLRSLSFKFENHVLSPLSKKSCQDIYTS